MQAMPERLGKCFLTVFPDLDPSQLSQASVDTVAQWDSVATVTLSSLIEEEFGMSVEFEDIEKLTSFEKVVAYLNSRQA